MADSQNLFDAAIRTIGLLALLNGTHTVAWGLLFCYWPHYWNTEKDAHGDKERVNPGQYFFSGIMYVLVGVFLMCQAGSIVAMCY